MNEAAQIASTILAQLGGHRFLAMTGARDLLAVEQGLQFKFPTRSRANRCRIVLNDSDLYDVIFYLVKGADVREAARKEGLYADQLRAVFAAQTGLETSL